jgi:succinate-semialdehyde dehydrogenase/glutarate-semialdehyde dehydrogenase
MSTTKASPMGAATLTTELWLGGRTAAAHSGSTFPVHNPATGAVIAEVADASARDAVHALELAADAQRRWADTAPRVRGELLRAAFELLVSRTAEFAELITLEMGKPLRESVAEVNYGAEFLRWFSEEAVRINGRNQVPPNGNGYLVTTKVPVGPVLAVTPWNFPLAMGTRKIAPALAAGCTIVIKPAEETPLTMLSLGQVFADVGLPPGVLSILPTTDPAAVVSPLLNDSRLRKLTFTGSTNVGKQLLRQSADQLLRTSMELGGNAPFLVFDDADIDAAVSGALAAKMRTGGQACTAANRFHVANSVIDEFTDKLVDAIGALVVGNGDDPRTDVGPLISERQRHTVSDLVADAVQRGARVRVGGHPLDGAGYFYAPTVLDQIPADARLLAEEIFGPVAAIAGFDTEAEGIAAANRTEYGLASYFYTRDLSRAARGAAQLQSGMIGINRGVISDAAAPFGGIKHSGFGREGGLEGIADYLETKYVAT